MAMRTPQRAGSGLAWGVTAVVAIVAASGAVGVLHLIPPFADLDPVRRTISEYALLDNGWVFNLAVLLLAAGSAATLVGLTRAQLMRPVSLASIGLALWSLGLAGVVIFPKHNWAVGPSVSGDLHRAASLAAFVSLPVAALALAWAWRRDSTWRGHARWAGWLGVASLAAFSPLLYAIVSAPVTGIRWWRAVPLGGVERALALTETLTVLALALWALRARRRLAAGPTARTDPATGRARQDSNLRPSD